ncbi:GTP cyclohydrolase I type 2 [Euzebya pacifica]|uniref:GTP cyclohydrolase FolE2 n=1 Tax=Euzebya pacifica TaxID=1608957 RepID=A0A346XS57_9ACTN|nr:GTP cyclohydrolase FolE2 [Euzebya pacifica]AXV05054.1 GTP cyclohydrolase I type 2 [Euzebya pacifica]
MSQDTTTTSVLLDLERSLPTGTTLIAKRFTFDSAHMLPNVPEGHKCGRVHGHTYQVKIFLRGPVDEHAAWIVDFGDLKARWKPIEERLDHHMLNELPGLENPTAERLAAWIAAEIDAGGPLADDVQVAAVEVAETPDSSAIFLPGSARTGNTLSSASRAAAPVAREAVVGAAIEDVQGRPDSRGVRLDEVGVSDVRFPITVLDRERERQATVGTLSMGVDVPAEVKGTHMSRFLEALNAHDGAFTLFTMAHLASDLRRRLGATDVRARVRFPYFVMKAAPVTGAGGIVDHDCEFDIRDHDGDVRFRLTVEAPVTTVCPCSRDISDYGAHNQRGTVRMTIDLAVDLSGQPELVWIEELIELADAKSSSPVYSVIKRPDERHVTMAGYDNPRFVEDLARDVAIAMEEDPRIAGYEVCVVNDESIHSHNAYATVRSEGWQA